MARALLLMVMLTAVSAVPVLRIPIDCPGACECDEAFEEIYCAKKNFQSWPFHQLHVFLNARYLDISGNFLTHIPLPTLQANFPSLEVIDISGNPFPCHAVEEKVGTISIVSDCPKVTSTTIKPCHLRSCQSSATTSPRATTDIQTPESIAAYDDESKGARVPTLRSATADASDTPLYSGNGVIAGSVENTSFPPPYTVGTAPTEDGTAATFSTLLSSTTASATYSGNQTIYEMSGNQSVVTIELPEVSPCPCVICPGADDQVSREDIHSKFLKAIITTSSGAVLLLIVILFAVIYGLRKAAIRRKSEAIRMAVLDSSSSESLASSTATIREVEPRGVNQNQVELDDTEQEPATSGTNNGTGSRKAAREDVQIEAGSHEERRKGAASNGIVNENYRGEHSGHSLRRDPAKTKKYSS